MAWPTEQRETTEFGDDCGCWPAGETPLALYAHFDGIADCFPDDPPGHGKIPDSVLIEQDPEASCAYFGGDLAAWSVSLQLVGIGLNILDLMYDNQWFYFYDEIEGGCEMEYDNTVLCNAIPGGEGGAGSIHEGSVPPSARQLEVMDDLNLDPSLETFYKQWPTDNADKVLRLNNRRLSINVRVKYTP